MSCPLSNCGCHRHCSENACAGPSDDGDRLYGAALLLLPLPARPLCATAVGGRDRVLRRHAHAVKAGPAIAAIRRLDWRTCRGIEMPN